MITFSDSELSIIREALTKRALALRLDELSFVRCGLNTDSIHSELLLVDSALSKLSK